MKNIINKKKNYWIKIKNLKDESSSINIFHVLKFIFNKYIHKIIFKNLINIILTLNLQITM